MNKTKALSFIAIVLTLAAALWAYFFFQNKAFGVYDYKYRLVDPTHIGFELLYGLWPLVAAGAIAGFFVFGSLFIALYEPAEKSEIDAKLKSFKERAESAEENARQEAERIVAAEKNRAYALQEAAAKQIQEANEKHEEAMEIIVETRTRIAEYDEKLALAHKRTKNAICAAERIKRKHGEPARIAVRK